MERKDGEREREEQSKGIFGCLIKIIRLLCVAQIGLATCSCLPFQKEDEGLNAYLVEVASISNAIEYVTQKYFGFRDLLFFFDFMPFLVIRSKLAATIIDIHSQTVSRK